MKPRGGRSLWERKGAEAEHMQHRSDHLLLPTRRGFSGSGGFNRLCLCMLLDPEGLTSDYRHMHLAGAITSEWLPSLHEHHTVHWRNVRGGGGLLFMQWFSYKRGLKVWGVTYNSSDFFLLIIWDGRTVGPQTFLKVFWCDPQKEQPQCTRVSRMHRSDLCRKLIDCQWELDLVTRLPLCSKQEQEAPRSPNPSDSI